jgi:hypothetical protein
MWCCDMLPWRWKKQAPSNGRYVITNLQPLYPQIQQCLIILLRTHWSVYYNPAENCQEALHATQYSIMHVCQLSTFQKSVWRSSHLHTQQATMYYENRQYDCRMQTLTLKILWIIDILVNSDESKQVENDNSNDFYGTTCLTLGNTGNL